MAHFEFAVTPPDQRFDGDNHRWLKQVAPTFLSQYSTNSLMPSQRNSDRDR